MRFVKTWGPLLLWIALMAAFSSIPHLRPPALLEGWDAVFHLIQFTGLGALLYRTLSLQGTIPGRARILALTISAVLAVIYEGHKLLVPGRHTSVIDFITDLFGALAGLGLVQAGLWRKYQ